MLKKIKKVLKRIKKFIKRIINKIKYKFCPDSLTKKEKKRIKKEKEISNQYSRWGNFLRHITGCNNLKVNTCSC